MKKTKITKFDFVRWFAIVPCTILLIFLYTSIFTDNLYLILNRFFNEEIVAHIVGFINSITLPIIIIVCGYSISPKYKFKSTLILVLFFASIQLLTILDRINNHWSLNPYIYLSLLVYLSSLFLIYKTENEKRK